MTKTEIIDAVAEKSGLSKKDSKLAVDAILDTLTETLSKKESVAFLGFGTFSTASRDARVSRVPGIQIKLLMYLQQLLLNLKLEKLLKTLLLMQSKSM